jgi:hypothetical protein
MTDQFVSDLHLGLKQLESFLKFDRTQLSWQAFISLGSSKGEVACPFP